jgi:hypothetical protein
LAGRGRNASGGDYNARPQLERRRAGRSSCAAAPLLSRSNLGARGGGGDVRVVVLRGRLGAHGAIELADRKSQVCATNEIKICPPREAIERVRRESNSLTSRRRGAPGPPLGPSSLARRRTISGKRSCAPLIVLACFHLRGRRRRQATLADCRRARLATRPRPPATHLAAGSSTRPRAARSAAGAR